jgi:hypothetical protein
MDVPENPANSVASHCGKLGWVNVALSIAGIARDEEAFYAESGYAESGALRLLCLSHRGSDERVHELGDITTVRGNFSHEGR